MHNSFEQQRRALEQAIALGPDTPVLFNLWCAYCTLVQTQGDRALIVVALECAVRTFLPQRDIVENEIYATLWLQYAASVDAPLDCFRFIFAKNIGKSVANVYVGYARALLSKNDFFAARRILVMGKRALAFPRPVIDSAIDSLMNGTLLPFPAPPPFADSNPNILHKAQTLSFKPLAYITDPFLQPHVLLSTKKVTLSPEAFVNDNPSSRSAKTGIFNQETPSRKVSLLPSSHRPDATYSHKKVSSVGMNGDPNDTFSQRSPLQDITDTHSNLGLPGSFAEPKAMPQPHSPSQHKHSKTRSTSSIYTSLQPAFFTPRQVDPPTHVTAGLLSPKSEHSPVQKQQTPQKGLAMGYDTYLQEFYNTSIVRGESHELASPSAVPKTQDITHIKADISDALIFDPLDGGQKDPVPEYYNGESKDPTSEKPPLQTPAKALSHEDTAHKSPHPKLRFSNVSPSLEHQPTARRARFSTSPNVQEDSAYDLDPVSAQKPHVQSLTPSIAPSAVQIPAPSHVQSPTPSAVQIPAPSTVQIPAPYAVQIPAPSPVQTPAPSIAPSPVQSPEQIQDDKQTTRLSLAYLAGMTTRVTSFTAPIPPQFKDRVQYYAEVCGREVMLKFLEEFDKMDKQRVSMPQAQTLGDGRVLLKEALPFTLEAPYRVVAKFGEGASAHVFHALDESGSHVAIKFSSDGGITELTALEKLKDDPSFLKLHRLFLFGDGYSVLLMDACQYGGVINLVNTSRATGIQSHAASGTGGVQERIAIFLIHSLITSVMKMHDAGLLHTDIRPENCLLRIPDQGPKDMGDLILIDFGRSLEHRPDQVHKATWIHNVDADDHSECFNVRSKKPFSTDVDYYGIATVAHVLLFGAPLQLQFSVPKNYWRIRYTLSEKYNKRLWSQFFRIMLNAHTHPPPTNRHHIERLAQDMQKIVNGDRSIAAALRRYRNLVDRTLRLAI